MGPSLVVSNPDIEVNLRHLDGMGGWAGEVKTLVVFITVALLAEGHVVPGV